MLKQHARSIVLLHGWGYTPHVWKPLIDALVSGGRSNIEVITPDITDPNTDLGSIIPPHSVVIGWSLGGMLAMRWAAKDVHEKAAKLILIGTTPRFVSGGTWESGLPPSAVTEFNDTFVINPRKTMRRFVSLQALNDVHRTSVTPWLEANLVTAEASASPLLAGLRTLFESDLRDTLPAHLPATIIHGAGDAVIPISAAEWMADRWPAASFHRLEGIGHAPHVSAPDTVARIIQESLHAA